MGKLINVILTAFVSGMIILTTIGQPMQPDWSDSFAGPAGSPPDPQSWTSVVNGAGGGNNELEYYVPEANALNGNGLTITAARDNGRYQAWYGASQFTSGKLWTLGKVNFLYGHIQVTAALPAAGQPGAWPAIWMLGSDFPHVGWPQCGEIDMMENFGVNGSPDQISSSIHTPTDNLTGVYTFPAGTNATTEHTYAIDWRQGSITFSVDGNAFFTVTQAEVKTWPFSSPFFMILNLAVGGTQGGTVPSTASLPYEMEVSGVSAYNSHISR